jgi:hypothetical protein
VGTFRVSLRATDPIVGHYPYPPETYSNVFAQLQAIVHGDPPGLPDGYSAEANDFIAVCLRKDPRRRPSYGRLMVRSRAPNGNAGLGGIGTRISPAGHRSRRGHGRLGQAGTGSPRETTSGRVTGLGQLKLVLFRGNTSMTTSIQ